MKKYSYYFLVVSLFFTLQAQPPSNLNGIKICIDQGHGGYNSNDRNVQTDPGLNFWESESNFYKGLLVKALLEARGAQVFLTRPNKDSVYDNSDNDEPSLTARWTYANANNVHWLHSIHSNAGGGNYTMVLLKEDKSSRQPVFPEAVTMSSYIYQNIRANMRTNASGGNISGVPGVYKDYTFYGGTSGGYNLGVFGGLTMPGELSEGSFHDYLPEARRLLNNDYRKMEAYGILNGFLSYYGVPKDTNGIIAGIQLNSDDNKPQNSTIVRVIPSNKIYTGDQFNNGFYMFDSLQPGAYKIIFESKGFAKETVAVNVGDSSTVFVDKTILTLIPPFVQSILPAYGDTNVVNTNPLSITFSKVMDTATVRQAFSISPSIEGSLTWTNGNATLLFSPKYYFQHATQYTVQVTAVAKSVTGLFLDGNKDSVAGDTFASTFKIKKAIPPYVLLSLPKVNDSAYSITGTIGIKFSKAMDTTSLKNAFTILPVVTGVVSFSTDRSVLYFKPASSLQYETSYSAKILGTAISFDSVFIDGNKDSIAGDDFVLPFKTQQNPAGVHENSDVIPTEFSLSQNYPNPFNPTTNLQFSIVEAGYVNLKVYDLLGRGIATLINSKLNVGRYTVLFDAANVPSGIYFYRLTTEKFTSVKRMMVIK
ncbi:MAG: Ig-like domain-containing protein [Bacteroidota bacterium]|nr:Ig-like domain-containing protein [Bacteroidota bacterium]